MPLERHRALSNDFYKRNEFHSFRHTLSLDVSLKTRDDDDDDDDDASRVFRRADVPRARFAKDAQNAIQADVENHPRRMPIENLSRGRPDADGRRARERVV